jgi:hypothetical protein
MSSFESTSTNYLAIITLIVCGIIGDEGSSFLMSACTLFGVIDPFSRFIAFAARNNGDFNKINDGTTSTPLFSRA